MPFSCAYCDLIFWAICVLYKMLVINHLAQGAGVSENTLERESFETTIINATTFLEKNII